MLAAMAFFLANDTMVKLAGADLPTGQIIFLRGLMASGFVFVWAWLAGALRAWRLVFDATVAWRIAGEVLATLLYLSALMLMPIGNITAILQVVPLAATAGSALFLGEHVGWRRWSAAMVGFAGVLLIVRPGAEGFNWASLLALASVAFIVLRDLTTRQVNRQMPALLLTLASAVAVTIMGAALGILEDWRPVSPANLSLLAASAAFLLGGYMTIIIAMRSGDVSVVAPFRYSIIVWALLSGYLVWGDLPKPVTLLGIFIVVTAGIYTFQREARLRAQARARLAAET